MPDSVAERLIELAREVRMPRGALIVPYQGSTMGEVHFRRIALALKLAGMPPAVQLRAMVEGWNMEQLVREMY